jgi:hypothetical protein
MQDQEELMVPMDQKEPWENKDVEELPDLKEPQVDPVVPDPSDQLVTKDDKEKPVRPVQEELQEHQERVDPEDLQEIQVHLENLELKVILVQVA